VLYPEKNAYLRPRQQVYCYWGLSNDAGFTRDFVILGCEKLDGLRAVCGVGGIGTFKWHCSVRLWIGSDLWWWWRIVSVRLINVSKGRSESNRGCERILLFHCLFLVLVFHFYSNVCGLEKHPIYAFRISRELLSLVWFFDFSVA